MMVASIMITIFKSNIHFAEIWNTKCLENSHIVSNAYFIWNIWEINLLPTLIKCKFPWYVEH